MKNTIERLKELEKKASPSPWTIELSPDDKLPPDSAYAVFAHDNHVDYVMGDWDNTEWTPPYKDAEFIVAMRNTLPLLLELAEAVDSHFKNSPDSFDNAPEIHRIMGQLTDNP